MLMTLFMYLLIGYTASVLCVSLWPIRACPCYYSPGFQVPTIATPLSCCEYSSEFVLFEFCEGPGLFPGDVGFVVESTLVPCVIHLHPMVPSVVCINIGKYNIFHRPDKAMMFVMVKACLCANIILSFRTFENLFFIYMELNRKRVLHLHYS